MNQEEVLAFLSHEWATVLELVDAMEPESGRDRRQAACVEMQAKLKALRKYGLAESRVVSGRVPVTRWRLARWRRRPMRSS